MLKSRDRSRSRDVSRPIFDGLGLGLGLEGSGLGLGLGLEASGLGLSLGLEGSGLVNITVQMIEWSCYLFFYVCVEVFVCAQTHIFQ